MSDTEYRIEYTIQRADGDGEDFIDIGFGSSAAWGDIRSALYAIQSDVQNYNWETEGGMPDPDELRREAEEIR